MAKTQTQNYRWVKDEKIRDTYTIRISERLEFLLEHFYPNHKTDRVYSLSCIQGKDNKRVVAGAHFYPEKKSDQIKASGDFSSILNHKNELREALGLDDALKTGLESLLKALEKETKKDS